MSPPAANDGLFLDAYRGRRVLVTGHTGFKGTWLCTWLLEIGAEVTGYALEPPTTPSAFDLCGLGRRLDHGIADVRDADGLLRAVEGTRPAFIFHMAAQSLVRRSYVTPAETFETNVMGTVNLLEAVRRAEAELEKAQQLYQKVRQDATERLKAVREKSVGDLIDGTLEVVKRHPGPGLILAAIIGFFLGRLFRR